MPTGVFHRKHHKIPFMFRAGHPATCPLPWEYEALPERMTAFDPHVPHAIEDDENGERGFVERNLERWADRRFR